jgi:hypothetical protein
MTTEPISSTELAPVPQVQITVEYGRKLPVSEAQMSEWLDDLGNEIDEIMAQPLRVGPRDGPAGLSRFAFCAPEMIRGAVASHILRTNLAANPTP